MIRLDKVSKRFIASKALQPCSITMETGRIIGLIGENGSGKTTMLKLLAGLLRPTKGQIQVDGQLVNRRISGKLAYLTDQDYFYPYFTIDDLLHYYQQQFDDFDRQKALGIARFMKLDLKRKIKHLSKGNRGRVKIMVTLARNAPYIVLDEPFSGLDPMVRKAIVTGMIKFIDLTKQTLIISTHELKEVEPILDEVVLLQHGKIVAQKRVEDIREEFGTDVVVWMERMYEPIY
ncbi:ABC transporter ATP-binding protein [Lentibacillus sp. N15]|uniref:ABC transporter ATP-binding protein n=1 Tax=Lentibacillus songyuanensis TaxID=3136161 RepID=UPI0031BA3483